MKFVERKVLETLLAEAKKQDYYPDMIEALDARGEDGSYVQQNRMQWQEVMLPFINAWDSIFEITFRHAEEPEAFWVQIIPGNGTDLIHDHGTHPDAESIMDAVYKEIEA